MSHHEGILLLNKELGKSSFDLVRMLRKKTSIQKIGFAGTLDPLAEGVMIMLIGKPFTRLSEKMTNFDKEYHLVITLGKETSTYDAEGEVTNSHDKRPVMKEIETALSYFQGNSLQTPPMFSAKKVNGKKLYLLARKGVEVKRPPVHS